MWQNNYDHNVAEQTEFSLRKNFLSGALVAVSCHGKHIVIVTKPWVSTLKNYRQVFLFPLWCSRDLLYYRSLFFTTLNCHTSVQKLSNHLVVPWMSKRDHIFLQISESRYPDNPNITEFTFESVTIHSLNLKLASTSIVLLFQVDTDISILF